MHCSRRRFIIVAASLASTSILVDEAEAHTLAWPLCDHGTDCDATRESFARHAMLRGRGHVVEILGG
jgi:hypothetical protein